MSLFVAPNSSRLWLRPALRGLTCRATATTTAAEQPFLPVRWISSRTPSPRTAAVPSPTTTFSSKQHRNPSSSSSFASAYPRVTRRTLFSDKTIRKYEDLPRDYRDQAGLPFRDADLTDGEVLSVFGRGINARRANHLLRILHGRRVAGTLDDPAFAVHTAKFTRDQVAKALVYLRKSVVVDEVLNAGLRAEDELEQMEAEMEATERADKDKAKAAAAEEGEVVEETKAPVVDPIYGTSLFDQIRARNVAKRKSQELADKEARKAAEAGGETITAGPLAHAAAPEERQIQNPKIAEYYKQGQSDLKVPPELKAWERILPSVTVVGLVLGLLATVAAVYQEPEARYRVFPEVETATATLGALIALNVLVYLAWKAPPMWSLLNRYMIFCVATPKPLTLFTATFSHQKLGHLVINMLPIWAFGILLHEELGRADFLALYLGCGALGFAGSLVTYTLRGWLTATSLGASGVTHGLCAAYFWEHRDDGFRFFGVPDDGVHGIIGLAMLVALQLLTIGKTQRALLDVASHWSGTVAGVLGMAYLTRDREREKRVFNVVSWDFWGLRSKSSPWDRD